MFKLSKLHATSAAAIVAIISNHQLFVLAQNEEYISAHGAMWNEWDHHERLMLANPPEGTCNDQLNQAICNRYTKCTWNDESNSCVSYDNKETRSLRASSELGRKLQTRPLPTGWSCELRTKPEQCYIYTECEWSYNTRRCSKKITSSPTKLPTTASPTTGLPPSGQCRELTNPVTCESFSKCSWKKGSCNLDVIESTPTTKQPANPIGTRSPIVKPTRPAPTMKGVTPSPTQSANAGGVCSVPPNPKGCASLKSANQCDSFGGCVYDLNKKKCNAKLGCVRTEPPIPPATRPPTLKEQPRTKMNDMCIVPQSGCSSVPSTCETFNGCVLIDGRCYERKCNKFDCVFRQMAFDMAREILPRCNVIVSPLSGGSNCEKELKDVHDALELEVRCGFKFQYGPKPTGDSKARRIPSLRYFVSDSVGNDETGLGTFSFPFKTIQRALEETRTKPDVSRAIVIRAGTYYITETIKLKPIDSKLSIVPFENDKVILSGAIPLTGLNWQAFKNGIQVADVSKFSSKLGPLSQIFINEEPMTRARHPNANPWTDGLFTKKQTGYFPSAESWAKAFPDKPDRVVGRDFIRLDNDIYGRYIIGYGGHSKIFDPPASYWAINNPRAGGGCQFELPRAVTADAADFRAVGFSFSNPSTAYVHAYHIEHWGNWIFKVGSQNGRTFNFESGGFQEARGSCGKGGSQWYIENMIELLDEKGEYFYDQAANKLYLYPNSTGPIPTPFATVTRQIFDIRGTRQNPVKDVLIAGFQIQHTYPTHMDKFEVPSAGDWSVTRQAAVFMEGVERVVIEGNGFYHMGGNAVFISNYAKEARVMYNSMKYLGGSAILLVGDPRYNSPDPWNLVEPNHPDGCVIDGNIASEIGNVVKQSAGFFQALGRVTTVANNVFFNSERSAINFNDGYGGDNLVEKNLMFNTVRSTIDHGPFNSWDRLSYVQTHPGMPAGSTTGTPLTSVIRHNYLLGGYGGIKGIDHDDGSAEWENYENLLIYGYQKLKGRNQDSHHNVVMLPADYATFVSEPTSASKQSKLFFRDNKIVTVLGNQPYGFGTEECCLNGNFKTMRNEIYHAATFNLKCGDSNFDWNEWRNRGQDSGSSLSRSVPILSKLVAWGKDVLNLKAIYE